MLDSVTPLPKPRVQAGSHPLAPPVPYPQPSRRLTLNLPLDLLERVRNVAYWVPALTITGIIRSALQIELTKLEQRNGGRFPRRRHNLMSGRPRGLPTSITRRALTRPAIRIVWKTGKS